MRAGRQLAPPVVFVPLQLNRKYITYNADAREFAVESSAIDNDNAPWEAFYRKSQLPRTQPRFSIISTSW